MRWELSNIQEEELHFCENAQKDVTITTRVKGERKGWGKRFLINHLKNEIIVRIYKAHETLMSGLERKW